MTIFALYYYVHNLSKLLPKKFTFFIFWEYFQKCDAGIISYSACIDQHQGKRRVCPVFVILCINSREKPVTHCPAGSLCPAMLCPVRQRAGTETRPYNG